MRERFEMIFLSYFILYYFGRLVKQRVEEEMKMVMREREKERKEIIISFYQFIIFIEGS